MAFIQIEFGGQKTAGGYLKIDGGKQIKLADGMVIPVEPGTHYLSFSSESGSTHAMAKANAAVGNYGMAASLEGNSKDGEITVELGENDMMFLTVVSDKKGKVLSLPTYSVRELDEEELKYAEGILGEQQAAGHARSRKRKKIWGVILAIVGVSAMITGAQDGVTGLLGGLVMIAIGVCLFLAGTLKKKTK